MNVSPCCVQTDHGRDVDCKLKRSGFTHFLAKSGSRTCHGPQGWFEFKLEPKYEFIGFYFAAQI